MILDVIKIGGPSTGRQVGGLWGTMETPHLIDSYIDLSKPS